MKFVNRGKMPVKVQVDSDEQPRIWVTLKEGEFIETEKKSYAKHYEKRGLIEDVPGKKLETKLKVIPKGKPFKPATDDMKEESKDEKKEEKKK